jgi:hypothetical protein
MERLTHTSQGIFNSDTWLEEGNGLLVSAAAIRKLWHEHGDQFVLKLQDRTYKQDDIALNNQLPRATHLLLGYAAENLLKCGIAKAYIGCPEKMFKRDIRIRFSHNLCVMADEINFNLCPYDRRNLVALKENITETRYPTTPKPDEAFIETRNKIKASHWSKETFDQLVDLVAGIKKHVEKIDQDLEDPRFSNSYRIDEDGFLALRVGGGLPPRVSYRASSRMQNTSQNSLSEIKKLIASIHSGTSVRILHDWASATILEDTDQKTRPHSPTD